MDPRKEPLTPDQYKKKLPRYFKALSDALKGVVSAIQESDKPNYQAFNKALLNKIQVKKDTLLMLFTKYIECAELAGLNVESLKQPLDSLKALTTKIEWPPISGGVAQYFQEQIVNPIWNFHHDEVFIKQGILGDTTFPVGALPQDIAGLVNAFSKEIKPIARAAQSNRSALTLFKPNLEKAALQELLDHIICGNLISAMAILNSNPQLLRLTGDCVSPSGDHILGVTPYGCALGAGDNEMAAQIRDCFLKIQDGAEEEAKQYAKLKPSIDAMLTQEPSYDLSALIDIIIKSPNQDVTAALNCDKAHKSKLGDALEAFRRHFAPRKITEGMHFNYQDILNAVYLLADYFDELESSGNKHDKCDLFWRQVIGYLQLRLPACDRQALAQGIYFIVAEDEKLQREVDFRYHGGSFPIVQEDDSFSGLGFDSAVAIMGLLEDTFTNYGGMDPCDCWEAYVNQKLKFCIAYGATAESKSVGVHRDFSKGSD